ncbi:hypothetical protein JXL83_05600 [candidate division WOR-3 bacterium]|nr:hypothetical protein [candidate division WOR-3 bacterium]
MQKSLKRTILISLPSVLIGLGLVVAAYFTPPEAKTDDGHQLKLFLYIMGGSFSLTSVFSIILLYFMVFSKTRKKQYLIANGRRADAEIIEIRKTGTVVNNCPQVILTLRINTYDRPPYTLKHKIVMSETEIYKLETGRKLKVYVDPKNSKNIYLETGA